MREESKAVSTLEEAAPTDVYIPRRINPLTRAPEAPPPKPASSHGSVAMDLPAEGQTNIEMSIGGATVQAKNNFVLLGEKLEQLAKGLDWGGGQLSCYVEDAKYKILIFDRDGSEPMKAGEPQKLITLAAAIDLLGPEFQFETQIQYAGDLSDGRLKGNLIVRGSGDPSISSRQGSDPADPLSPFRGWADRLKELGVESIDGSLIGDDSALDVSDGAPGWPAKASGDWSAPEISALSYNENLIEFRWLPLPGNTAKARYSLAPLIDYIQVQNSARIDAKDRRDWRVFKRGESNNLFHVVGSIPAMTAPVDYAAIHDPTSYFMAALKAALEEAKIDVLGPALSLANVGSKEIATGGAKHLFTHASPPLKRIAAPLLRYDFRVGVELVYAALGRKLADGGTFDGGRKAVAEFLRSKGISDNRTVALDGSGLSRLNRSTARQFVEVFKSMTTTPKGYAYFSAFPRGGQPGVLEDRFNKTGTAPGTAPRIFGVPGHVPGGQALAGWAVTQGGRRIFYAFILNDSRLGKSEARRKLDELAIAIAQSRLRKEL